MGYLYRFNSAVQELKEQIKKVGDIHYISARYIHSDKPPRTDSGAVFNLSIHLIDILNFVLEKTPEKVFCKKINYLSKEREDCAVIVLDYGNFMAELEVSWFHPLKKRDMWVIGSKKKVYADFLEQVVQEYTGFSSFRNIEIRKNEPLKEELRYFCSAAEGKENGKNEGAEEINILKVCEACLKSAEKGEEVKI